MTTLHARAHVGPNGRIDLTIPAELATTGAEVIVTIRRATPSPVQRKPLTREEKLAVLDRTAGSIPDFQRLHPGYLEPIPPLDDQ